MKPQHRPPLGPLAALFFISGVAGLLQEIAWLRVLGQSLGGSAESLAAVLVAFLGGLAIGAAAAGRLVLPRRAPLARYAALEGFCGLYAWIAPWLAAIPPMALARLGPLSDQPSILSALRLLLALAILLPPAIAMGATFPVMIREGLRRGHPPPPTIALLYGANTLGGACGASLASFALLPFLGTRATFRGAGVLDLLAAAGALALARTCGTGPQPGVLPADREPHASARGKRLALAAALSCGISGALLQIGWTRIAALSFGSTIYALGVTLTAYILGIGTGPLIARRLLRRAPARWIAAAALGSAGFGSFLLLPLLGSMPVVAARLSGSLASEPVRMIATEFILIGVLLLVPTLALGAAFPPLAALAAGVAGADRAAGSVYAASTWGAVVGYLLAGFVTLPALGTRATLVLASSLALLTGAALLAGGGLPAGGGPRRSSFVVTAILAAAAPALPLVLPSWDPSLLTGGGFLYGPVYRAALGGGRVPEAMHRRGAILYEQDGAGGLVTVRRSAAGVLSLQINGKTEASTGGDIGTQLLAGHLPLLLHPRPRQALVIGLASGITAGAVERHPVESVRVIEIAPAVEGAARLFEAENHRVLDDPRTRLVLDDARGWLLARDERYDVITSQPSNPWVAGVSNLFTVEFYRLARLHLNRGGLFCQWVQAYRLAPDDLRGIVRSFLRVFPQATLWEESVGGGDYFLLAGEEPLRVDPRRLGSPASQEAWADLRRAGVAGPADLVARFVSGPAGLTRLAGDADPVTDDDPYLEWSAPLALFRDTLREQVAAINRHREPPLSILDREAAAESALMADLAESARRRRERLALLDSLRDADLWALWDPFLAAGIEYLRAGRFADAAPVLARGAAANPQSAAAQLLLAQAYGGAGLDAAAEVAFRAALERDPDLAPAWNGLGRSLAARGDRASARAAFVQALRSDPGQASARNNLGAMLIQEGDIAGAVSAFRAALDSDPDLAAARANLGLALKRRGDLRGAERELRAALEIDPENGDARYNLAALLRQSGRGPEAREQLLRLLEIDPADRDAARTLAEIDRKVRAPTGSRRGPEGGRATPRGSATASPTPAPP